MRHTAEVRARPELVKVSRGHKIVCYLRNKRFPYWSTVAW